MSAIVLYHGDGCMDGKMAAYVMGVHLRAIYSDTVYLGVSYNEPVPDIAGKHVYIVDFSYPISVLQEMSKVALSITMLDHHLTAAQEWGGYFEDSGLTGVLCPNYIKITEDMSGAGLALQYIQSRVNVGVSERLCRLVGAVQDRDLWLFKLEDTQVVCEVLSGLKGDWFTAMDALLYECTQEEFDALLFKAQCAYELREKLSEEYALRYDMIKLQGHYIPAVNLPSNFSSRVGEILAQKYPFALVYTLTSDKVRCSLRSNVVDGLDVSEIAKTYQGGGHFHAAGFKLPIDRLVDLVSGRL